MKTITDPELNEAVEFLMGAGWRIVTSARQLAIADLRKLLDGTQYGQEEPPKNAWLI